MNQPDDARVSSDPLEETRIPSQETTVLLGDAGLPGAPWPIGALIEDRYQVAEVRGGPGVSGMGIVYVLTECRPESGGRRLAAKTFQRQYSTELPLIERFLREARAWILTGFHPNVVRAFFLDIIEAAPYLFMEYVSSDSKGRLSLADHIADGPIDPLVATRFAAQFCEGMIHATESVPGLVHRDLKPENLLIAPDNVLKITDFGLVRCHLGCGMRDEDATTQETGDDSLTHAGSVFGTPAYMAPEQFLSAGEVTMAADIYAFGCCFYEAISGKPPFQVKGDSGIERLMGFKRDHMDTRPAPLREVAPACPPALDKIFMRCLEKDPLDRWPTFGAIREQLVAVLKREYGVSYRRLPHRKPSAKVIAEHEESLTLLKGYERAVRLRNLREGQDTSPFAFHLALASYFHCTGDVKEERRQLEKAGRVRGGHEAYEVARRLGDLLVAQGELENAEKLLGSFLAENSTGLDDVLEPYVGLMIAKGDYAKAENILNSFPMTLRTGILRAQLLTAAGRLDELTLMLRESVQRVTGMIQEKVREISKGDAVGWDRDGDWDLLRQIMEVLSPGADLSPLDQAAHVVWPDLTGSPDFSSDMAWLSEILGLLSQQEAHTTPEERQTLRQCAEMLDYPERLRLHRDRDEHWFWSE